MSNILNGVIILIVGMCILFAAMAVLNMTIVILDRVFRVKRLGYSEHQQSKKETINNQAIEVEEEEIVASIATALIKMGSLESVRSRLGASLEAGHGLWWSMRRIKEKRRRLQ